MWINAVPLILTHPFQFPLRLMEHYQSPLIAINPCWTLIEQVFAHRCDRGSCISPYITKDWLREVWDTFGMKGYFQPSWKRNMCNEFWSIWVRNFDAFCCQYLYLLHRIGIHTINYGIRFLTKTCVLLGGNELHAPSQKGPLSVLFSFLC